MQNACWWKSGGKIECTTLHNIRKNVPMEGVNYRGGGLNQNTTKKEK